MRTAAPFFLLLLVATASAAPIVAPRDYTPTQGAVAGGAPEASAKGNSRLSALAKGVPGSEAQVVPQTTWTPLMTMPNPLLRVNLMLLKIAMLHPLLLELVHLNPLLLELEHLDLLLLEAAAPLRVEVQAEAQVEV